MPNRSRTPDDPEPNEPPKMTDDAPPTALPEPAKNPAAVSLGRLGGLKGGKARAAKMTKKQRSESAKKAAQARWKKKSGAAENEMAR